MVQVWNTSFRYTSGFRTWMAGKECKEHEEHEEHRGDEGSAEVRTIPGSSQIRLLPPEPVCSSCSFSVFIAFLRTMVLLTVTRRTFLTAAATATALGQDILTLPPPKANARI